MSSEDFPHPLPKRFYFQGIDLGFRDGHFSLRHGIRVPILPSIVRHVASYRMPDHIADEMAASETSRQGGFEADESPLSDIRGSGWVHLFKVMYPADFIVAVNCVNVRYTERVYDNCDDEWPSPPSVSYQTHDYNTHYDETIDLSEAAGDCWATNNSEIYDDEFRRLVQAYEDDEDQKFWESPAQVDGIAQAALLVGIDDHGGKYARHQGHVVFFDSSEGSHHRFLAAVSPLFPDGQATVDEVVAKLQTRATGEPGRYLQNLTSRINTRLAQLQSGRELKCLKQGGTKIVSWVKTAE